MALKHGYYVGGKAQPEYNSWYTMMNRCYREKTDPVKYQFYGGRGITVCKRWHKFENFLKDMGLRPSLLFTLDRIDNNRGYSLKNCRWADKKQQSRNTRKNHKLIYAAIPKCISEWAIIFKMRPSRISRRLTLGWSIQDALEIQPVRPPNHRYNDLKPRHIIFGPGF